MTIVVGVDGSEASHAALAWAVDEARLRKASLHVVHSWTFPPVPTEELLMKRIRPTLHDAAEQVVADALTEVDTTGVEITREVADDLAARALLRASEGAELLVVGSRGMGGVAGALLGSVSQHCVHHARCPVVVVPHAERR